MLLFIIDRNVALAIVTTCADARKQARTTQRHKGTKMQEGVFFGPVCLSLCLCVFVFTQAFYAASAAWYTSRSGTLCASAARRQSSYSGAAF